MSQIMDTVGGLDMSLSLERSRLAVVSARDTYEVLRIERTN